MAIIPVNFMTFPENPRIGVISCPVPYIRRRILDYLRKRPEVERCGRLFLFGAELHFCVTEGHTADETAKGIRYMCPVFIAEMQVRRPWIRRNFWILWGTAFGIMHILNVIGAIMDGDLSFGIFSWLAGFVIVAISLMNYQIGRKREEALLVYVRQECIKRIAVHLNEKEDEHEHL